MKPASKDRSESGERGLFAQMAGLVLAVVAPLLALAGPNQEFANLAIVSSVICILIAVVTSSVMRVPFLEWALTPVGIMLCFMVLALGVVPLLWTLGVVEPWAEVEGREVVAARAGILLLLAFAIGVWVAAPKFQLAILTVPTAKPQLTAFLGLCLIVGVTGYLLLAAAAGGPAALLFSLADRRDSLAGTGPLRAMLLVAAVGCVVGVAHRDKSARQRNLTLLCGLAYFAMNLLTGARIQALIVVIAAFAAYVHIHGSSRKVVRNVALSLALAIPASTFYGLRVRQGLTYGQDVEVVDESTTLSAVASLVGPFVNGGVDSLRTLGVVSERAPTFDANVAPIIGSLVNIVPRSLWPNKPDGSATAFSARYFSEKWADGTGVPPSISAELMNTFGIVGGLIAMAVLGFVVARGSQALNRSPSMWMIVVGGLLTADALQFAKGGSDGFIRSVTMQVVALIIAVAIAHLTGLTSRSPRATAESDAAPRHPLANRAPNT